MRKASIFAATLALGQAHSATRLRAEDTAEIETVSDTWAPLPDYNPLSPGPSFWNESGFGFGIVAGIYGPLSQRAGGYSCFNETWNTAWNIY
jgi:hypothetical protein